MAGELGSIYGETTPHRIFWGVLSHHGGGNAQQDIFLDDEDRQYFLGVLARVVSRFHPLLHAYCLMDNHFHLVVETLDGNFSKKAMRQLIGVYMQAFNPCHQQVGHGEWVSGGHSVPRDCPICEAFCHISPWATC